MIFFFSLRHKMVIVVAFLLGVGCGGGGEKSGLYTLDVMLDWKPQMEQIGLFAAQKLSFYRDAGLNVVLHPGNGATTTATLVAQGGFPVGMSSGGATIIAKSKGADLVSVAVLNQRSPTVIYSLESSGIRSPSDLVGKKLGVTPSGVKYWEYVALMSAQNISRSGIEEVSIGKAIAPLLSGQVDALLGYTQDQPVLVELEGRSVNRVAMADYGVDLVSTNLIVTRSTLEKDSVRIAAFVHATLRGYAWAIANPDSAVSIYLESHPENRRAFSEANFAALIPILRSPLTDSLGLGWHDDSHWVKTEATLREQKIIDAPVDVSRSYTNNLLKSNPVFSIGTPSPK